jgi:hypothetical protein
VRSQAGRPDWITDEGFLDPLKLPLHPILKQALHAESGSFRDACSVLKSIAARGGYEAGVFLLGLLVHYREDPPRMLVVVDALGGFATRSTADALAGELYRVPSTHATRGYLNAVLDALTRLPRDMWEEQLMEMAHQPRFSPKWRQKFEVALWS